MGRKVERKKEQGSESSEQLVYIVGKLIIMGHDDIAIEIQRSIDENIKLNADAKKAQIKMAEQNWAQRHYVWWTIISALIGGLLTYGIEKLGSLLLGDQP